jgi:hypothetical protein
MLTDPWFIIWLRRTTTLADVRTLEPAAKALGCVGLSTVYVMLQCVSRASVGLSQLPASPGVHNMTTFVKTSKKQYYTLIYRFVTCFASDFSCGVTSGFVLLELTDLHRKVNAVRALYFVITYTRNAKWR